MTRKFLLCLRWYAVGLILTYSAIRFVPSAARSGAGSETSTEPDAGSASLKHPLSSATADSPSLAKNSRSAAGVGPPVLPKIETQNDLWAVLMDEELRPRFLGNAEILRRFSYSDWIDVVSFCTNTLNWNWEKLESAIAPDAQPLLKDYLLNGYAYSKPEEAWDVLITPEPPRPDRPVLFERELLLERAAVNMARVNPERFLKDLPSLPEESRKECLREGVPGLMSALELVEAVAAVRAQLDALPAKDHREVLNAVFDNALLHPAGEESVREMLETLPEGSERESLKREFEERRLAATRDDPLQ